MNDGDGQMQGARSTWLWYCSNLEAAPGHRPTTWLPSMAYSTPPYTHVGLGQDKVRYVNKKSTQLTSACLLLLILLLPSPSHHNALMLNKRQSSVPASSAAAQPGESF
jgi:hypothetical protein